MNIVLIGYRGTGKSTVGRILAEHLGREFLSTDTIIVERARLTIPEIVQQTGWDSFRDLETQVCRDLADKDSLVIDTGGGVILRQENVECLKRNGILFWLTADVPVIAARVGGDTQRPSLTGTKSFVEEIEEVLRGRLAKYEEAADHVIPTDRRSPEQVAEDILTTLEKMRILI